MADRWLTLAEHAAREDRLNGGSCSEIDKFLNSLSAVCAWDPARAQRQLRRFMASKTKATPQKEEMLEKEGAFVNLKTKKRLRPLLE